MATDTRPAEFFATTPFVDAYTRREGTYAMFEVVLRAQAVDWGEQGLGRALVHGEQLPELDDQVYVLAIGRFDGTAYAAVQKAGSDTIDVVEFDWPLDWDVT